MAFIAFPRPKSIRDSGQRWSSQSPWLISPINMIIWFCRMCCERHAKQSSNMEIIVFWVWLHQLCQPGVGGVYEICMAGDGWLKLTFFKQNWILKLLKPWEYLGRCTKSWGVVFWLEEIGPVFPTRWNDHDQIPKSWLHHSVGNTGPIPSHQNNSPDVDVFHLHKYSHGFSNFNDMVIQFFEKH